MKRAGALFAERLKDARRVRDATDRLIPDVAGDGVARADVIIEAIFENLDAKRALFAEIEKKARHDAILATNTSSIPIEEIASALADPSRLIGLHFFNPVPRMMLVEIVAGRESRETEIARGAAFARQIDKLPLPVRSAPGFLVNRVLAPYLMTAMRCVDEGIAPETVDEAALAFGMPMGPIELADTVGLDICVAVGRMLGSDAAPPVKLMTLVDAGKLGKKSGQGFYSWVNGKPQKQAAGAVPEGLAQRLVTPYVQEAKAALDEHIVADADLVDAGAIFGTGFAPFRGGPLHYAETSRAGADVDRRSAVLFWYDAPHGAASGAALRRHRRTMPATRRIGVEKIWLSSYPPGVPAEIDINEYASVREVFEESCGKFAARPAFTCMGRSMSFAELDHLSSAFGAFLQGAGCKKGTRVALMMPNILQYPVCLFGILRAGCTVVNVNPLYTARELEHQLVDSGAELIVVVENFAHVLQEVIGKTKLRQAIITSIGELLGMKGVLVDLVIRRVKKMVPAYSVPGSIHLSDALMDGRKRTLERVPLGHDDIAFLQYTGRHDRGREGRDAAPPQHRREPAAGARVGVSVHAHQGARDHHHAAPAVSHLLADGELPDVHDARRGEHPDSESARHTRLREGDGEAPVHGVHRRQYAVQRVARMTATSPSSTSRRCISRWAAAWPCRRRWRSSGRP